jgi:murein DD-endopeptidase MepM/ murein hydrolase activator NlpD
VTPVNLNSVIGTPTITKGQFQSETATPTLIACFPCRLQAEAMTARIPATQTAEVMQATETAIAPTIKAMLTGTAEAKTMPAPTAAQACGEPVCYLDGHFLFQRPVALTANQSVDRSYPYGGTQNDTREVHHGVEFYNAQGTPVLAAADGDVVFAGDDKLTLIAWVTGFYGNVIVLKHNLAGATFYTLYGHLYKIDVVVGQAVKAGEQIGEVGATGTAVGSHLHFEVRRGKNDYKSTRNPELWLMPLEGTGVLAGTILDEAGNAVKGTVNVQRVENGTFDPLSVGSASTYPHETINSDDVWKETFVLGEIPAGEYRLSLVHNGVVYEQIVKIEPGKLTLVKFIVK